MSRTSKTAARGALLSAAFLAASTVASTALAQECLLGPVEVPGLYGPPVWFGAAGASDWRPQLHDPRWSGSPLNQFDKTPGGVESTDGTFRMLISGTTLYVSFEAMDDTTLSFDDAAYFAFTQGTGGSAAVAVKITPDSTAPSVAPPALGVPTDLTLPAMTTAGNVDWFNTPNSTIASPVWTAHQTEIPPWLTNIATWRGSPGVGWAITFQVDLSALGVTGALRMFHGMIIDHPTPTGILTLGTPVIPALAASVNGDSIIPQSSGNFCTNPTPNKPCWQDVSAVGTACTAGITLTSTNIGVWNGSALTNQFHGCGGATPCPTDGTSIRNQIRVKVENVPSLGVTAHAVRAQIRIADWGAAIMSPNAPWKLVTPFPLDGVFTAQQSALTSDPSWAWNYNSGTQEAIIDYTCNAAPNSYCPTLSTAAGASDQCMLVELGRAPGVSAEFGKYTQAAVYQNMSWSGLSSIERPATVSLRGIKAVTGEDKDRDVYLHVLPKNMPPHGEKPVWMNTEAMVQAAEYALNPPPVPMNALDKRLRIQDGKGGQSGQKLLAQKPGASDGKVQRPPSMGAAANVHVLQYPTMTGHQALSAVWPTYEVKAYYDTGTTFTVKGLTRKVLEPMAPFGLYLSHNGALYGFTHSIEGMDGVTLEPIGQDWYVARKVKSESSFRVKAKIVAEETAKAGPGPGNGTGGATGGVPCPPGGQCPECKVHPGHCGCRIGYEGHAARGALGGLAALGIAFGLRRRRRQSRR
jgi:MYXO-CTERM domain-containing protein